MYCFSEFLDWWTNFHYNWSENPVILESLTGWKDGTAFTASSYISDRSVHKPQHARKVRVFRMPAFHCIQIREEFKPQAIYFDKSVTRLAANLSTIHNDATSGSNFYRRYELSTQSPDAMLWTIDWYHFSKYLSEDTMFRLLCAWILLRGSGSIPRWWAI